MEYILEKLEVYQLAETFSDEIWFLVVKWDNFKKDTIESNQLGVQIRFQLTLPKDMEDISIKKVSNFIFIPGDQYRKPNPGSQNAAGEGLLNRKNSMNFLLKQKRFLLC